MGTANSRSGLEAWPVGVEATDGIAMMFGVHGGEEISCGFVLRLLLPATPMHEQTIAEPAQHAHDTHGFGQAHAALVVQMTDVQAQMQAVFNAPSSSVVCQPLFGIELMWRQAGQQRNGLGLVLAQLPPQQGHLFDTGEIDLFRAGLA